MFVFVFHTVWKAMQEAETWGMNTKSRTVQRTTWMVALKKFVTGHGTSVLHVINFCMDIGVISWPEFGLSTYVYICILCENA